MSDGSGLREGTGLDGSKEKGSEFNTIYFYRGRGRITGGTSRGRGKRENDGGESSRGGRERGRGRGRMDRKDGGESSGAGGGRGRGRGSERGRSSGRGISDREDGGTGRGKIYEVSEEGRRKTGETGKGRSNGRGQTKGRVNQNGGTEISNKGTKGKRSDKEDKGMSRGDRGKEREGSAGGPGETSAFIRTLVGRLLTGRFDDGGGIKISGDEGAQSRFDVTDRRENVKTSWPSEASAVGGKGEIRSAVGGKEEISSTVGGKGEISSTVGGKGEISSAAGGNTKTTRRKLKIKKKIVKEPYYKRARVVRKPPRSTLLIDKDTSKFMVVWKRRRLLRYRVKAERTLLQKKKTYRTEWKVRNKFGIRECNNQVTRWKFILNSDQGRQAKESKIQLIYSTSRTAPAPRIPTPAPKIPTPAPTSRRPALRRRKTKKAPKPRKVQVPRWRYNATIPRYTSYEVRNTSLWSLEFGMFFTQMDTFIKTFAGLATWEKLETLKSIIGNCSQMELESFLEWLETYVLLFPTSTLVESELEQQQEENKCFFCSEAFSSSVQMKQHYADNPTHNAYRCDHCEEIFTYRKDLKKHMNQYNSGTECSVCDLDFKNPISLYFHSHRDHKEKQIACDQCDITFCYAYDLKMHIMSSHDCILLSCDFCSKQYLSQQVLDAHVQEEHKKQKRKYLRKKKDGLKTELTKTKKEFFCDYCGNYYTK
ncbi:uncharacterized protein LOC111706574 isoform X2 [Eurytemora carolleeae]|uniref:uncharacterized protein LOC111706574 isoform X2 n=1 Tax=Eurytemora carolleeae TaxID=1294199 RepID=UPI000C78251F|nr:uncharacterized protein LOC111706574 isoform X2 [Eurytemora carolleeae]|eukprot:XP_023335241.1 uncharacterized protein LOC111706574 isoform X2 [Eurytemora affinis]